LLNIFFNITITNIFCMCVADKIKNN